MDIIPFIFKKNKTQVMSNLLLIGSKLELAILNEEPQEANNKLPVVSIIIYTFV